MTTIQLKIRKILFQSNQKCVYNIIDDIKQYTSNDIIYMIELLPEFFPDSHIVHKAINYFSNSGRIIPKSFYSSEFIYGLLINNTKLLLKYNKKNIDTIKVLQTEYINGYLYSMNWEECEMLIDFINNGSDAFKYFIKNSFNQLLIDTDYDILWDYFNIDTFKNIMIKFQYYDYKPMISSNELFISIFGDTSYDIDDLCQKKSIIQMKEILDFAYEYNIKDLFDDNVSAKKQLSDLSIPNNLAIDHHPYFN